MRSLLIFLATDWMATATAIKHTFAVDDPRLAQRRPANTKNNSDLYTGPLKIITVVQLIFNVQLFFREPYRVQ